MDANAETNVEYYNTEQVNVQVNTTIPDNADETLDASQRPKKRKVRRARYVNPMNVKHFREFTLSNGVLFKGLSAKKSPLTGDGQLIYTDGSLYVGQIKKGYPDGHGEKIWSNVDVIAHTSHKSDS